MKLLTTLLLPLLAALSLHPSSTCGAVHGLEPSPKPLKCSNASAFWGDEECIGPAWLLPEYWLPNSKSISDDRLYHNYDKIMCSPSFSIKVCAFIEHADAPVPGYQIKRLMQHLAHWCDQSLCGECRVDEVEGPVKGGWFKVDSVREVGNCYGVCE